MPSTNSTGSRCSWVGWPCLGRFCWLLGSGVSLGRGEAGPGKLLLAVGGGLSGRSVAFTSLLILSDGRGRSVVEGNYVPKLAELGVLCMPASFVTHQRPQGLVQDCLRHWAESQHKSRSINLTR